MEMGDKNSFFSTRKKEDVALSKTIAFALRHNPQRFGLNLDNEGWTSVDALLAGLRSRHPNVSLEAIQRILAAQQCGSEKVRYEVDEEKMRIRALHGHSVGEAIPQIVMKPSVPPPKLFHGTSPDAAASIKKSGVLRPMRRQYVHLSTDQQTARMVGRRKAGKPVILEILAETASQSGATKFYQQPSGDQQIWLADSIPIEHIIFPQQ